jgi:hypothetical protein
MLFVLGRPDFRLIRLGQPKGIVIHWLDQSFFGPPKIVG